MLCRLLLVRTQYCHSQIINNMGDPLWQILLHQEYNDLDEERLASVFAPLILRQQTFSPESDSDGINVVKYMFSNAEALVKMCAKETRETDPQFYAWVDAVAFVAPQMTGGDGMNVICCCLTQPLCRWPSS